MPGSDLRNYWLLNMYYSIAPLYFLNHYRNLLGDVVHDLLILCVYVDDQIVSDHRGEESIPSEQREYYCCH